MPAQTIIKVRRDTAENWASTNPVLAAGEHGFETDTGKFKIGNGTTAYVSLDYATDWANITEKPTLGTAASKDVAATGDASSTQVVLGSDTRLTDSRTPTAHAASHTDGGSDEITVAPAQITASATSGQVLSSNGTTTVWSDPAGGLPTIDSATTGEMLVSNGTTAGWSNTVTANSSTVPAIIAKGTTSQTANLQEWQMAGSTTPAARVSSTGDITTRNINLDTSNLNSVGGIRFSARLNGGNTDSGNPFMFLYDTNGTTVLFEIDERGEPILRATNPKPANTAKAAGYKGMPQVLLASGGLTLNATHAGEHIYVTGTGQTITIPQNGLGGVAFEIGTTIVIINAAAVTTSIAITNDTLLLAGAGTTGTRTLGPHGMATLVKITATSWIISGNGLS